LNAILVDNISKNYRIGGSASQAMLREAMMNVLQNPFRPRITIQNEIWALRNVDFSIEQGELVGIIGRNGAGKSTLLKILSRITYPTSGFLKVLGRIGSLLEVGTGFHEELTGRENIYLNGSILGMKRREIERRMDEIVAFADVEKFVDTPIKRYSSGMRLRLGFAVAAHLDTDILFVDEVLAVGDVGFQKKCLSAMGELRYKGRTVLFVSHNMAAVEHLCPRSIWVEGGQVREDGRSAEVIKHYMGTFSNTHQATVDFASAVDRRGSGAIRYLGVDILDFEGNHLSLVQSGDSLVIRLHYEALETVTQAIFGFQLFSAAGVFLTDVSTWNLGVDIPALSPGRGYLDLAIDCLNLMPGRYFLSLWLTSPGEVLHDVLEHCTVVDVEPSNFYKSGRGIESRFGILFFPCRWNLAGLHVPSTT
jgi:homopolymeric O-antigen transport system ATP-binding protein